MRKFIALFVLLCLTSLSLFAAGTDELQKALSKKDVPVIQAILDNAAEEEKADFEALILQKAKEAVARDNLDFASSLAEMVLISDFDNTEAQKLYTSIEKAKKAKAETEARKKAEEQKKAQEEEQKRLLQEFQEQQKKAEEQKNEYIDSVSKITFENFPMSYAVTLPLDFSYSSFANQYNGTGLCTRFGTGADISLGFNHPYVEMDLDINYNFFFVGSNNSGMKSDLKTRFSFGLPSFSKWFRLSLGFNTYTLLNNNNNVALYTSLTAPTLGIGVDNIKFSDNLSFAFFTDINLITLDPSSEIDFAFDAEYRLRYTLPVEMMKKGKLYIENKSFVNTLFISNKKELALDTMISVGVSFNE